MSQATLTLHDLMPSGELAAALEAGHITRKRHPGLPLSIYTYTRACQYAQHWNAATTRCRGLVADDAGRVVALPLPKFFNVSEHTAGRPYAPPLPDEPFEVFDKVDGSLAVVFHYEDHWHAASKGSFTSVQATWTQRRLDASDTTGLTPGVTYLAEMVHPANRIVVNYGDRRDLVLLAAFAPDGTETPLAEAAEGWHPIGSVVGARPFDSVAELVALTESDTLPDGSRATGTDAEGFVLRFASGLRAKAKLAEYIRLHKVLTGVTERDIWRGHGIQRFAALPAAEVAKGIGCSVAEVEADGGKPLDALLEQVPDEFDAWVREVVARLETAAADRERAFDEAYAPLAHLAGDRAAFARAAARVPDRGLRAALFLRLDGRPTDLLVWRQLRPETSDPFTHDQEN
ncbi:MULTISPECIES: T4 RnlA family RNA ligase [unclassified Streptomyces]|uniref:T4 RnlA family RNA ligase n=1 Tax=unclassified Streptomyces TaxID=2593676 RepID=UPI001660C450|nr:MULTISPECIES: T4 RnlA family RNA ligase [unclassified Streptomyces]MBD0710199.1 polynucleotide kinase [Streptomyces sp. CBMA291]MBD0712924.1 polynucleotide kinase [Streptomyces sp. CBMA370]